MMSAASDFVLGIDISQESLDAALCPAQFPCERWRSLPAVKIAHRPDSAEALGALQAWLREQLPQGGAVGVMVVEATGQLSVRFARAAGALCAGLPAASIVNPRRSHAFGQSLGVRDKSDDVDARVLAVYGEKNRPRATALASEEHERLRQRSRLRERYVRDLTAWENRLREALDEEECESIERTIEHIKREIERVDKGIGEALERSDVLRRQERALRKARGIKVVVARTLSAELGDLRSYGRGQIVAAVGVFPKRFESGTSVHRKPRMAKGGGARVRRVLYMAACSLFRAKGPWPACIERLSRQGLNKMQITGVLMRKLLLIARAVAITGVYDESKICCGT